KRNKTSISTISHQDNRRNKISTSTISHQDDRRNKISIISHQGNRRNRISTSITNHQDNRRNRTSISIISRQDNRRNILLRDILKDSRYNTNKEYTFAGIFLIFYEYTQKQLHLLIFQSFMLICNTLHDINDRESM